MAIARWTPMAHFLPLHQEMNRLFDQFFRGGNGGEVSWGQYTWTLPVDIYETDDALVLMADLPGVPRAIFSWL